MLRRIYFFGICVAIMGVWLFTTSCAPLPKRIDATHLSCKAYPNFEPVRSHKIVRSENGEVIRIDIDRPVRVLRVSIYANRDLAHTTREPLTQKTKVTFNDIVIQEIRVYQ